MKKCRNGKNRVIYGVIVLFMMIGIGLITYPYVANKWNEKQKNKLLADYCNQVAKYAEQGNVDYQFERALARQYNEGLRQGENVSDLYEQCLNLNHDGMMGYISIPKIQVELPIYHSTNKEVLQKYIGHQEGTSLPIGGAGCHAVLAGHRGLPSNRLFTDLDQIEVGDFFYIFVLDEKLTYKVDNIEPMIDKDDTTKLNEMLQAKDGKDYVTLLTCTPYGVNTHRLLVRGQRVVE